MVFLRWGLWVQGIRCCQALLLLQMGQLDQACRQYQGGPETRVYVKFTRHRPGSPDLKPVMLPEDETESFSERIELPGIKCQ